MIFESKSIDDILVIRPMVDRIDAENSSSFKSWLVDYILQGKEKVALDLSEVEFMDSSGLSALLSTVKTMKNRGRMVFFGVGANVGKLFTITRLDRGVFEIHPHEQSAVEALRKGENS